MSAVYAFRGRTLSFDAAPDIMAFAEAAFGAMRLPAESAANHRASVRKDDGAGIVFDGEERRTPAHRADEAAFYATRDIFARFAAVDPTSWAAYGAAVRIGRKSVVLLGPSTAGKTVLVLHVVARGAQLYGDETFVVDRRDGSIEGMPRRLLLREASLPYFPNERMRDVCRRSTHALETTQGRLWYAIDPSELFERNVTAGPAPLGAIVLISRKDGTTSLEEAHAKIGLMELTRRLYRRPADLAEIAAFTRVCGDVPTYRISAADPGAAAALLHDRLSACA